MTRYETIQLIMDNVTDEIVICNIGHPSRELYQIKDRPKNFYMLGSMGLASSIGLGMALSQAKKVLVIEGEGSVLMNLGTLATIGITHPDNLSLFIIDNESYGSTGFQPTFTSQGLNLAEIAKSCKISNTHLCQNKSECAMIIPNLIADKSGPSCAVIKTSKEMPDNLSIISFNSTFIKNRLMDSLHAEKNKSDSG
jgi:sulfopyruvate decarboxylase subunit beta